MRRGSFVRSDDESDLSIRGALVCGAGAPGSAYQSCPYIGGYDVTSWELGFLPDRSVRYFSFKAGTAGCGSVSGPMPGVATGTVFLMDTHEVDSVRLPAQLHPTALYCSDCMELLCFVDYGLVPVVGIDRDLGKQGHLSGVSYYPIFSNAGAVVFGDTVVGWYWNGFARVLLEGVELDSANAAARSDALNLARRVLGFIYMSNYLRLAEGEPETSREYERLVEEVSQSPLALRLGRVLADFAELTPYEGPRSDDDL